MTGTRIPTPNLTSVAPVTSVTAADIATNTAAHALFSNKLLGHVAGDTAAALVAARRMRLLARAASAACSPI